ncbi:MAG: hypothetical protein ACLP50_18775 [Solirubrobacteraceae bacterium]
MNLKSMLVRIPSLTTLVFLTYVVPAVAASGGGVYDPGLGQAPPGNASADVNTIISWIAWLTFAACLVGVLVSAVTLAFERQGFGSGGQGHTKLMWALGGCIVAGSASAIVGALA